MAEFKIEPEPTDGRYDLCKCGHNRGWHYGNAFECVAEVRFFPEQIAQCSCEKFRLSGDSETGDTKP